MNEERELLEMIDIIKSSSKDYGRNTIIKDVSNDSLQFVLSKMKEYINRQMKNI